MPEGFISNLYVFLLAGFVGFEVIRRVSPLLHTPLMSLSNALDAIVVVAAIIIAGREGTKLSAILGAVAAAAAISQMCGQPSKNQPEPTRTKGTSVYSPVAEFGFNDESI